jgi:hypothetical protein
VAGKSPLEYLTIKERARQRDIVLALLANPPSSVPELIRDFVQEIETYAKN